MVGRDCGGAVLEDDSVVVGEVVPGDDGATAVDERHFDIGQRDATPFGGDGSVHLDDGIDECGHALGVVLGVALPGGPRGASAVFLFMDDSVPQRVAIGGYELWLTGVTERDIRRETITRKALGPVRIGDIEVVVHATSDIEGVGQIQCGVEVVFPYRDVLLGGVVVTT